ncbi:MAG: hypothetical protein DBY33_02025 [Lachnospiraceae bacterium]|nr:MAG: hypothetical protein DBY33_02025 [Lachnospiraceae bacterium]
MNYIKSLKVNYSLSAVICVILGIVLLVWPGQSTQVVCMVLGIVLGGFGLIQIILYLATKEKTMVSHSMMMLGVVLAVIGGWIVLKPETIIKTVPMIVGILIVIHGFHNAVQAIDLKKMQYDNWWVALLLSLLTVALGVVLICNPFTIVDTVVRIIGAFLVYDGLSDMWILSRVFKTKKNREKIIDTDAVIVDEDE